MELEIFLSFATQFGLPLTIIALTGIIILGILKYNNVFNKIPKENRKILYFLISVGFSLVGSGIYLAVIGAFAIKLFSAIVLATYTLNQGIYAFYDTTSLKDLWNKLLNFGINFIKSKANKEERE